MIQTLPSSHSRLSPDHDNSRQYSPFPYSTPLFGTTWQPQLYLVSLQRPSEPRQQVAVSLPTYIPAFRGLRQTATNTSLPLLLPFSGCPQQIAISPPNPLSSAFFLYLKPTCAEPSPSPHFHHTPKAHDSPKPSLPSPPFLALSGNSRQPATAQPFPPNSASRDTAKTWTLLPAHHRNGQDAGKGNKQRRIPNRKGPPSLNRIKYPSPLTTKHLTAHNPTPIPSHAIPRASHVATQSKIPRENRNGQGTLNIYTKVSLQTDTTPLLLMQTTTTTTDRGMHTQTLPDTHGKAWKWHRYPTLQRRTHPTPQTSLLSYYPSPPP